MTQEDKELLLKDLCARLLYGVVVKDRNGVHILTLGNTEFIDLFNDKCNITPYLFPLSSMTVGQGKEFAATLKYLHSEGIDIWTIDTYDWCNKNHFDYRGLIKKGLALDATGLGIY